MNQKIIINKTINFVKEKLKDAEGGHDRRHIYRVWKLTKNIAKKEDVNLFIVELGALLHDIADHKFNDGNEDIGFQIAGSFLHSLNVEKRIIIHIQNIIKNISFKGGQYKQNFKSPELDVIQDADRLDAMGAIGIARAFNYGGYKNREIYNPNIDPNINMTKEEYIKSNAPTINHFYEKLLILKNKMNTKTGKKIAKHRHKYLEKYLKEFYDEWEGKK